jgi:ParB family chromosome partitioning protein
MARKTGLGKGLGALIPEKPKEKAPQTIKGELYYSKIDINKIVPNPKQPRREFESKYIDELAKSIKEVGLLQPIVVRSINGDKFELVIGERRLRASKQAKIRKVPALVRNTKDENMLKDALLENIHRVDLNPLEEAFAYAQLLDDFKITQGELSKRIIKSRSEITNTLRLLKLPVSVQKLLASKTISKGSARALLSLDDPDKIEKLSSKVVKDGLSTRQVEKLVAQEKSKIGTEKSTVQYNAYENLLAVENNVDELHEYTKKLSDIFSTDVRVKLNKNGGKVEIKIADLADLNRIMDIFTNNPNTNSPF